MALFLQPWKGPEIISVTRCSWCGVDSTVSVVILVKADGIAVMAGRGEMVSRAENYLNKGLPAFGPIHRTQC